MQLASKIPITYTRDQLSKHVISVLFSTRKGGMTVKKIKRRLRLIYNLKVPYHELDTVLYELVGKTIMDIDFGIPCQIRIMVRTSKLGPFTWFPRICFFKYQILRTVSKSTPTSTPPTAA